MLKRILLVVCLIFCMISCKNQKSKDQDNNDVKKDSISERDTTLIKRTNSTIFGVYYHSRGDAYKTLDYTNLHSVSYVSYEINPNTGGAVTTYDWLTTSLIDSLQANGVKFLLNITNKSEQDNNIFLRNNAASNTLIDNAISLLRQRNANGIHISFENISASNSYYFTVFISKLRERLNAYDEFSLLYVTLPIDISYGFDFEELNPLVDQFMILDTNDVESIKVYYSVSKVPTDKLKVGVWL